MLLNQTISLGLKYGNFIAVASSKCIVRDPATPIPCPSPASSGLFNDASGVLNGTSSGNLGIGGVFARGRSFIGPLSFSPSAVSKNVNFLSVDEVLMTSYTGAVYVPRRYFSSPFQLGFFGMFMQGESQVAICLSVDGGDVSYGANVDASKRSSDLVFVPLLHSYLQVEVSSVSINGQNLAYSNKLARFLPENNRIFVPGGMFEQILSSLKSLCLTESRLSDFLCDPILNIFSAVETLCFRFNPNLLSLLPPLVFQLGAGANITVPASAYILKREASEDGVFCGLFGINVTVTDEIFFGQPALYSSYVFFDLKKEQVGFASPNCTIEAQRGGGKRDPLVILGILAVAFGIGCATFLAIFFGPRFNFRRAGNGGGANDAAAAAAAAARRLQDSNEDFL